MDRHIKNSSGWFYIIEIILYTTMGCIGALCNVTGPDMKPETFHRREQELEAARKKIDELTQQSKAQSQSSNSQVRRKQWLVTRRSATCRNEVRYL